MRIIFDLDGTLIDSAPDINAAANAALAAEGLAPVTQEQSISFIGNGAAAFVRRLELASAGDCDPERLQRLHERFVSFYETTHSLTRAYPGVEDVLVALRTTGWKIGICTNKPIGPARKALAHMGWTNLFDTVIGAGMLPVMKPDPAPLFAVIEGLGGGASVYVGDSEVDAATAQAAHVPFALFTRGYRKSPVAEIPHDRAFDDFHALPEIARALLAAR